MAKEKAVSSKLLTQEIAEQFAKYPNSVDLREFTEIEDTAAQVLAECYDNLYLDGLTNLSDTVAQALAKHLGSLSLNGLTNLSDKAAQELPNGRRELYLNGLTNLTDTAAQGLAKHKGELFLDGLTNLSDTVAQALAKHKTWISLNGLTNLSDTVAQALAECSHYLFLNGLTNLTDTAAQALAKFRGCLLLNGLTNLTDTAAQALAKHEGSLYLDGLTNLSVEAVQAFVSHKAHVRLNGLRTVSARSKRLLESSTNIDYLRDKIEIVDCFRSCIFESEEWLACGYTNDDNNAPTNEHDTGFHADINTAGIISPTELEQLFESRTFQVAMVRKLLERRRAELSGIGQHGRLIVRHIWDEASPEQTDDRGTAIERMEEVGKTGEGLLPLLINCLYAEQSGDVGEDGCTSINNEAALVALWNEVIAGYNCAADVALPYINRVVTFGNAGYSGLEDVQYGHPYLAYKEDDVVERTLTPKAQMLKDHLNAEPKLKRWAEQRY